MVCALRLIRTDILSEEQWTALTKTATDGLRAKLVKAGYDEGEVSLLFIERPALLEAMAKGEDRLTSLWYQ